MKTKIYILSFIFFVIDLISKIIISSINTMPIKIINNFFYLNKVSNTGAAFSILTGKTIVFIIIAIIVLIYINKCLIKDINTNIGKIGICMLNGGIIGNLYDRIFYGKVIDFLSFRFGTYNFPIFNLADSFICIGILLLIIEILKGDKDGNKSRNAWRKN